MTNTYAHGNKTKQNKTLRLTVTPFYWTWNCLTPKLKFFSMLGSQSDGTLETHKEHLIYTNLIRLKESRSLGWVWAFIHCFYYSP